MKIQTLKKWISLVSFLALLGNATPIFAQWVELEILGGGYKLRGPSEINFATVSTSTNISTNELDFRDIGETTPSQSENNFLLVIDENGGNPFDVTVTSNDLKKEDPLVTMTLPDSTGNTLKVVSSNGFLPGDTFIFPNYTPDTGIYEIASVPDETTVVITSTFAGGAPPLDITVSRYVDCEITPKKCIALAGFSIKNGSGVETVYGNSNDFVINSQTNEYVPFKAAATTIAGSSGTTLKVDNSEEFFNSEGISFPSDSGVLPLDNIISTVDDNNTITLQYPFTSAPAAGVQVKSTNARSLTLGNGNGASPGQWKIYPVIRDVIPAGQLPGTYQSTLNFTIV